MSCAKINRPTFDGILVRERIFQSLEDSIDNPIVWISGPAGSGKTILVSSYIEARNLRHIWYQVDSGDTDVATFFYYLRLAAKKFYESKNKNLPLLTPEYLQGIPEFSRHFFGEFFRRLKKPAVLVFDNVQEVSDESQIYRSIAEGLAILPKGFRIILVSRREPPPQFVHLRVTNIMKQIGWHDLQLTLDECIQIIRERAEGENNAETFAQFHSQAGGWAAGLEFVLEGAEGLDDQLNFAEDLESGKLFDYFATQVFEQLDGDVQTCLLKTAFLRRFTVSMAILITEYEMVDRILENLIRRNFFLVKYVGISTTLEYHPQFRNFLLTMAEKNFSQEDLVRVRRKAALLMEEDGQIDEALSVFLDNVDFADMSRLLQVKAPDYIAQGRYQTLEKWLNALPERLLTDSPWLILWLGTANMPFSPAAARPLFEQAFTLFVRNDDETGMFLAWSGAVDAIIYSFDSFFLLDEWLRKFEQIISRFEAILNPEIEGRVISSLLNIMTFRQPWHADFEKWEERGLAIAAEVSDIELIINIHMPLIMAAFFAGDLAKAEMLIWNLKENIQPIHKNSLASINLDVLNANYCWIAGKLEECEGLVKNALELAAASGIRPPVFQAMCRGAAGMLSTGNLKRAKQYFDKMSSYLDHQGKWKKGFYYFLKAWHGLLEKKPGLAVLHAEKSLQMLLAAGMPQTIACAYLAVGSGLYVAGEHDSAANHLDKAKAYSRKTKNYQVEFSCWLADADLAFDRGDYERGRMALTKAMFLGRKHSYMNCYFWRPAMMARLCCKALEEGIESDYVRELVRQRKLMPESPPLEIEAWPWPVRIYTLGRFELVREGKSIRCSGKAKQKPLDLLKALIALGGRNVSEFRVGESLWPESDGDMQHQSLATTLHRLRKIVGIKECINYTNGHLSLDTRYCWVDAWAFERLLTRAETEGKEKCRESILSAARSAEKAINLYKGDFLPQVNREQWCINKKEHLRNRFLRGVVFLGRRLEKVGEHEKAVMHYQNAIDLEPLMEEFYQRLMIYYKNKGQYADAVLLYQRCQKNLETFLHVQPSKLTHSLFRSILADSGNVSKPPE